MPQKHRQEHRDDLTNVRTQQETNHFLDISVDASAFADCIHDGGKVIIGQGHVCSALGHIRAGDAHGAADIRSLQSRRIIDTVTGHGDHLSLTLPGLDDADLVFGRHTGINADVFHLFVQFTVAHGIQFGTGDGQVTLQQNAQLTGDGGGGHHMVTCDHHRLDAGTTADLNSRLGFRTGRIDHADQSKEGQTVFQLVRGSNSRKLINFLKGHCQNAEGIGAHGLRQRFCLLQVTLDAALRHHVESALDDDDLLAIDFIDGGHELAVRVEGDLRKTGILLVQFFLGHAVFMGSQNNGCFGGITDVLLLLCFKDHRAIAAESGALQKHLDSLRIGIGDQLRFVHAHGPCLGQSHAVLGQSAGLVGADDGSAAQRFHSRQSSDQRIFLHHTLHTDGQHNGHDGRQTLGNGGNRQRNGSHEDLQGRDLVGKSNHKDDGAGRQRNDTQILAHLSQLLLQGSLGIGLAIQQIGDLAHFRVHTGGSDHRSSRTVGNGAAGEDHIGPVADGRIFCHFGFRILFAGNGLTGQCRLLGFKARALEQTAVRRHKVAGFQTDDIAGNQLRCINDRFLTVPDHTGMGSGHIFQRIQRLFRFTLLIDTHDRIQNDDQQNQSRLEQLAPVLFHANHHKGNDGCCDQDQDHHILELIQKTLEGGFLFLFTELVFSVAFQPCCDLGSGQSGCRINSQLIQNLSLRLTVK